MTMPALCAEAALVTPNAIRAEVKRIFFIFDLLYVVDVFQDFTVKHYFRKAL